MLTLIEFMEVFCTAIFLILAHAYNKYRKNKEAEKEIKLAQFRKDYEEIAADDSIGTN